LARLQIAPPGVIRINNLRATNHKERDTIMSEVEDKTTLKDRIRMVEDGLPLFAETSRDEQARQMGRFVEDFKAEKVARSTDYETSPALFIKLD